MRSGSEIRRSWASIAALWLAGACADRGDVTIWRVAVNGRTVGEDVRTTRETAGGTEIHSERRYVWRLGDAVRETRHTSDTTLDADGHLVAFTGPRGALSPDGPTASWLAPPPPSEVAMFDPSELRIRRGTVRDVDGRRVFEDGEVSWWAELDGQAVRATGEGALSITLEPGPLDAWEPHDPADLLAWAATPIERPRAIRTARIRFERPVPTSFGVGHQRVDGDAIVVVTPLEAEVPTGLRRQLRDWFAITRSRIGYAPVETAGGPQDGWLGQFGDCTEIAADVVRQAVDRGVAARVVDGWVYAERAGGPALVPHAWVELTADDFGPWDVDPTLDQLAIDATHVRAPDGAAASWFARAAGTSVTFDEAR